MTNPNVPTEKIEDLLKTATSTLRFEMEYSVEPPGVRVSPNTLRLILGELLARRALDQVVKECVRYYSEPMNWVPESDGDDQIRIDFSDLHSYTSPFNGEEYLCGGKRARALMATAEYRRIYGE